MGLPPAPDKLPHRCHFGRILATQPTRLASQRAEPPAWSAVVRWAGLVPLQRSFGRGRAPLNETPARSPWRRSDGRAVAQRRTALQGAMALVVRSWRH